MTPGQFVDTVDKVFHDWHYDHPRILHALIRSEKPEYIVEVGTYRGYAAAWMAQACKENGKGHVWCIDDFSEGMQKSYGPEHWAENIAKLELTEWATLVVGKSENAKWPAMVDFAYIDGWHSYNAVRADFERAEQLGAKIICLDDVISTVGIRKYMQIVGSQSSRFSVVQVLGDNGLAICTSRHRPYPRLPTFSQELPGVHGTIMKDEDEIRAHLAEASKVTGINYCGVLS